MNRKNVIVGSILTLTVLAASSAMAFADTGSTTLANPYKDTSRQGDIRAELNLTDAQKALLHEARTSDMKEALANLVSEGTLTQAEADAIISSMPTEPADRGDGPFQSLTDEQKTALKAKLEALKPAESDKASDTDHADRAAIMTQAINALVKDGVLTQAEADAIIADMPKEPADKDAGPFQNLTEKQRTALQSELETLSANSLKKLVSDGSITQAQADILAEHGMGMMGGPGRGHGHRS